MISPLQRSSFITARETIRHGLLAGAALLSTLIFSACQRPAATPAAVAATAFAAAPGWVDVEGGTQHLGARTDGVVQDVLVHAGDSVAAKALLLRFDDRQLRIDAQLADLDVQRSRANRSALGAQLQRVREQIKRLQPLVDAQAEPLDALNEQRHAQADLEAQTALAKIAEQTAVLQAQSLHEKLARTELRAPRAGRVLRVSAHAGEAVASGAELLWFAAEGPLIVRAELDERLFGSVQTGMSAQVSPEYDDSKHFPARVLRVARSVGPVRDLPDVRAAAKDDRVVECDLALDADAPLLIGQRVLVQIDLSKTGPQP